MPTTTVAIILFGRAAGTESRNLLWFYQYRNNYRVSHDAYLRTAVLTWIITIRRCYNIYTFELATEVGIACLAYICHHNSAKLTPSGHFSLRHIARFLVPRVDAREAAEGRGHYEAIGHLLLEKASSIDIYCYSTSGEAYNSFFWDMKMKRTASPARDILLLHATPSYALQLGNITFH